MNIAFQIIISIFFTYGVFSFLWIFINKLTRINIDEIHNQLKGEEKVEVIIVFRNMNRYVEIVENQITNGNFENLLDIVDEYRCINIKEGEKTEDIIDKMI